MLFLFVLQFFGKIYIMKSFWKLYKTINKYISGNVTAFFAQSALKEKFSTQRALGRYLEGTWALGHSRHLDILALLHSRYLDTGKVLEH